MQSYAYQKYKSSLLAVSIIICARNAIKCKDVWRPELEYITGYSEADCKECYLEILKNFTANYSTEENASPDNIISIYTNK